jgi:hypothetical protein
VDPEPRRLLKNSASVKILQDHRFFGGPDFLLPLFFCVAPAKCDAIFDMFWDVYYYILMAWQKMY